MIFGRNDLVQDAPISRIDLLVCRNTLMYFNAETQAKILGRLHFALAPHGVLFLGKAEMLLSHSRIFDPVDLKRRVFRKTPEGTQAPGQFAGPGATADRHGEVGSLDQLREFAFSSSPVAQIVVTAEDIVALVNQQAETVFGLSGGTSAGRCATSSCPTGRSSCAATSSRPRSSGGPRGSRTSSGSAARERWCGWRST